MQFFESYFDRKIYQQASKIIFVYICVIFKAGFFLLLINYGSDYFMYFTKFKE